jgi:hypothetical protein
MDSPSTASTRSPGEIPAARASGETDCTTAVIPAPEQVKGISGPEPAPRMARPASVRARSAQPIAAIAVRRRMRWVEVGFMTLDTRGKSGV